MFVLNRRIFTHFDFILPILVLPLVIFSHVLISEASETLAIKQYVYFGAGFMAYIFFFLFPIRKFEWLIPAFYWVNIALLLSVKFFGVSKLGAKRWLEIPIANFTIQPSEMMKISLILMLAYLIKKSPPPLQGYKIKEFAKLASTVLLPFILIQQEPDLGTATILFLTGFGVFFIIGVNKKIWLSLGIIFCIASPLVYENLHDYQKERIKSFISKDPGYQVQQSIIAIGNGGIHGKNSENATQTSSKFLPIATSDFIFAYVAERFGFIGICSVMAMYFILIVHILSFNYFLKTDYFARVITNSAALMVFIYASVNIAMTIGMGPVVGVPLPFFSYGGSSFFTFMSIFGMVQNMVTFRYIKDSTIKIRF